jgi:uncharacterized protein YcnI
VNVSSLLRCACRSRGAIILLAMICAPSVAFAHAVVFPRTSSPGAYEKYVLRVPNERDVPTLRVEIRFPRGVRVVSFSDVSGWRLEVLRDTAQNVIGAVWTGVLPKERFVEFPFIAVNPKENTTLSWPTYQTYEGGERVEWTSPDSTAKTPASSTLIEPQSSTGRGGSNVGLYVAIAALLVALVGLGIALRPAST